MRASWDGSGGEARFTVAGAGPADERGSAIGWLGEGAGLP
jgi:hypothetical protein